MPDVAPRCPDCSVTMEEMELRSGGNPTKFRSDENREGLLGRLGVSQRYNAEAFVCPECGLSRIYADIDEE